MTTKAISYRQILYSLVAGLGAIMMLISWRAGYYIINIIALFTMLLILLGKARKEILIPTVFALTPPLLFIVLMPSYGTSLYTLGYFALPVFVTILSVALLLTKIEATRNVRLGIIALMVIGVAGLFAIDPAAISGKFADVLLPISRGITSTVAENAPAAFAQIYANLQILAVIAPVGVFLALKKFSPFGILFSLLAVTSLYAGGAFVWLLLLAAVPVAIVSGYVVTALIDKVKESQLMSRKMPKFKMWHVAAIGIIVIIGMVPLIQTSAAEENRPVMILTSSISTSVLVPDWMDALQWMANSTNMPADSTVIAWWDYGYWINIVGNQTVVCDNSTTNGTQIALLAEAFLSNETTALQIFKQLNGSYVVVYQVWEAVGSLYVPTWTQPADFEKSTAMMVWANTLGLNVTQSQYIQYYRINTTSGTVDWPLPVGPLASSCVLYQMIFNIVAPQYAQAGITINPLQYLQLVYLSPNGLVMIYKINYPT
jgi:dolichyl-diphosphooligosaccharide--protein glycosyltransferase